MTKEEHLEAHKGSWQNPTNWSYDPILKEFKDFGESKPTPCEVILLSDPISFQSTDFPQVEETQKIEENVLREQTNPPKSKGAHESFGDKILHVVDAARKFGAAHPGLTRAVKIGGKTLLVAGTSYLVSKHSGPRGNASKDSGADNYDFQEKENAGLSNLRDYPVERSSPREHNVAGYDRQQNGKTVHVNPYKRGGRNDD